MNDEKILHDDALVVQLTVGQIKAIIVDVLQEASLISKSEPTEILNIEEVSDLTGYKKATIYKLTHERKIPFHKPAHGGRRVFFIREEVNHWLQSNCVETYETISKNQRVEKEFKTRKTNDYAKARKH